MMGSGIALSPAIYLELVERAREALPNEACGLGAGSNGVIVRLYPLTNTAASPERYTVDPAEQLQAYRDIDDAGLECLAVYHSHPATPARPSATDLAEAYDPHVAYIIVSLAADTPSVRAFEIQAGTSTEIPVAVQEV